METYRGEAGAGAGVKGGEGGGHLGLPARPANACPPQKSAQGWKARTGCQREQTPAANFSSIRRLGESACWMAEPPWWLAELPYWRGYSPRTLALASAHMTARVSNLPTFETFLDRLPRCMHEEWLFHSFWISNFNTYWFYFILFCFIFISNF
jgi:hypothetical protein